MSLPATDYLGARAANEVRSISMMLVSPMLVCLILSVIEDSGANMSKMSRARDFFDCVILIFPALGLWITARSISRRSINAIAISLGALYLLAALLVLFAIAYAFALVRQFQQFSSEPTNAVLKSVIGEVTCLLFSTALILTIIDLHLLNGLRRIATGPRGFQVKFPRPRLPNDAPPNEHGEVDSYE